MSRHALRATLGAVLFAVAIAVMSWLRGGGLGIYDTSVVAAAEVIDPPFVMFRTLAPGALHGQVAMVPARAPSGIRHVSGLICARVHLGGDTGLCLREEPAATSVTHAAYLFDREFAVGDRIELPGIPTRVRVAPDGRRAAITIYAEEEAPDGQERLAINSVIVDTDSGVVIANLRDFAIEWGSESPAVGPIDFSSVAFGADSDLVYATLSTSTNRYVVRGSIAAGRLTIVAPALASEALSPDGTRLAVKKRMGEQGFWQLLVLDLASGSERALNQGPRSVDDQVEWLDDEHLLFHEATEDSTGVWALPVDGVTPPRLLIPHAYSPSARR